MGVDDDIAAVEVEKATTVNSVDDAQLLAMGKKPELQRVYNTWTRELFQQHLSSQNRQKLNYLLSMCISSHDPSQLVMSHCPILDHLRCWRPSGHNLGNVS